MFKKKLKVLYVSCSVQPVHFSGVATWIAEMAEQLKQRGHDIFAFTATFEQGRPFYEKKDFAHPHYSLCAVNVHNGLQRYSDFYRADNYINVGLEKDFIEALQCFQPDIVHFHALQGMGANLIRIARQSGFLTVLTVHDWWFICPNMFMADCFGEQCGQVEADLSQCEQCLNKIYALDPSAALPQNWSAMQFLERRRAYLHEIINDDLHCLMPVSQTIERYYRANSLNPQNVSVLQNGTALAKWRGPRAHRRDDNEIVIGYVGGNVIAKGFWVLLHAVAQLTVANWQLHAYGYGCDEKDPDIREFLSDPVNEHVKNNIKLMKAYDPERKQEIYQSFDLLVMPSVSLESFSLVVREALFMKLPTIITACGGPEEVIEHGKNGWVVPPNDASALAAQLMQILKMPDILDLAAENIETDMIRSVEQQAEALESVYWALEPQGATR